MSDLLAKFCPPMRQSKQQKYIIYVSIVAIFLLFLFYVVIPFLINYYNAKKVIYRKKSIVNGVVIVTDEGNDFREMRFCEPPVLNDFVIFGKFFNSYFFVVH